MWVTVLITLTQQVRREGSTVIKQLPKAHVTSQGLPKTWKNSPRRASPAIKKPENQGLKG